MFKSFRARLSWTYLLLILLVAGTTGFVASITFRNYYLSNLENNLAYESSLVTHMIRLNQLPSGQNVDFQNICLLAAQDTDARVTIVAADGRVLGDSQFDPAIMENHSGRPEIYQALHDQRGTAIRLSDTAKMNMLYVAIPFQSGTVNGAVRLGKPLNQVEGVFNRILAGLLFSILIIGFAAFFLSLFVAEWFSRPIRHITGVVQEIARGRLSQRITLNVEDELGILVTAINDMAENLEGNLNEISQVKNRLEAVLDNTVNGIVLIDDEGRIRYVNPAAMRLLCIDPAFMGRKHVELITNYEMIQLTDKVRKDGQSLRQEIVLHNLGGKILEANAVPVVKQDDAAQHDVLVVLNDITELKRLQQVRQDFVANISHELKTPVATISGFAETLLGEGQDHPENVPEFSRIIYEEAQRLGKMIKALLELSRLESGYQEIHPEKIKVVDIIENAVAIVRKRSDDVDIEIEAAPEVYQTIIEADGEMIVQVMINLLENALNHSREDSSVKVKIENLNDSFKVSVIDQGEGIPEKDLPRIFERFYRVDKARSRKTGGTGLGLAIVKHLVENHGGQVGVESRLGEGSTFFFTIPTKGF
ncbi:MAG TPA: ATP-binding protein [Syntrophomonadaceae bacterium]|nr:ATP-binding protein [Syntrophomonadaceae bacterium]